MNDTLRLRYSKTGKAKYMSHLELMSTMQRALIRAGIKLRYSQGFNPHPYISVALPLPIGCGSVSELMDFGTVDGLQPDGIIELMSNALPEGLCVIDAYVPERKFSEIAWIDMSIEMLYDSEVPSDALVRLTERFNAQSIIVEKKTKSGISKIDIAPHIKDVEFRFDAEMTMSVKVSAQNPTINALNLMSAIGEEHGISGPDCVFPTRLEMFDRDMGVFR